MIFGFNTDVPGKDGTYHVQTEDRGARNPVVESIVYLGGKILGKRRTSYDAATWTKEQIEDAVRQQHRELTEAVRTGTWVPPTVAAKSDAVPSPGQGTESSHEPPGVSLVNPSNFHQGEYFRFQLVLRDGSGNDSAVRMGLQIRWFVNGALADQQSLTSREDGTAEVWLPAPEPDQAAELLVKAVANQSTYHAKYLVRASA